MQQDSVTVSFTLLGYWISITPHLVNPQCVCVSVCLFVKSYLTSEASVCPENNVTYSAATEVKKGLVFSETTPLRSSTAPLKAIRVWLALLSNFDLCRCASL